MVFCVGLTGGIGCGKSTVAELFAGHGAGIIDTDAISRQLTNSGGQAIAAIRAEFGNDYITAEGSLDRIRMRKLIFADADAKRCLEQILHPLILEQARLQLDRLQDRPYVIIVVPLLPESPAFQKLSQRILVVDCGENTQIARVSRRNRMSEAEVRAIIAQQTPRDQRLRIADDVIHNDAGLDSLAERVAALHRNYSSMQSSI
ncbi:MAG: dephospho-CoA kinase [Gallionella sp.]|nr:dephospho-CoA kinase [Gallionella sp.]